MFRVFLCVATQHDGRLIALAALICMPATLATFFLYSRVPAFPAWRRWIWLGMTGLVAGSGIWTTHFLAMLAFRTGLPTGYAAPATIGSLAVAVAGTALGFAVGSLPTRESRRGARALGAGLVVGLAITSMHYIGMMGYRTAGVVQWDPVYVAASVLLGAVVSAVAFLVAPPGASVKRQLASGGLLSLAILAMHFTGMTAVTIIPAPGISIPESVMSTAAMALAAVAGTALIIISAIAGVAFDAASRNGNLRRLRQALDVMPEGLAFYDSSDRLVAWNSKFEDLCVAAGSRPVAGVTFEDMVRSWLARGAYAAAVGREQEWLADRMAARRAQTSRTEQTATGQWLRISDRRTADGDMVTVSVDVTDLKRTETAMAEARDRAEEQAQRAESAEMLASLGHWRLDVATQQVTWSTSIYEIYGLAKDTPLDLATVMAMTHPDDRAATEQWLARRNSDQDADDDLLVRIMRTDGEMRYLDAKSRAERDAGGRVVVLAGTVVDVTEQKLLEHQLRAARAEAEAAAAVKAEFLANMSHELRTPLTSIIGFTRLAADQADLTPVTRIYVDRVHEASRALLCTVNDILDFSKLEAGQASFHPQPVAIAP